MQLPDFSISGRVALLTGAGRGIARALAHTLAAAGAAVMIHDRDLDVAEAEADAIRTAGGRAAAIGGDATDVHIAEGLVIQTLEQLGGLHILVNSVSVQKHQSFFDHTLDDMQRELNANLLLGTRLCQLAIPHMQAAGWGRVINFSSIQALQGNDQMPVYAMSRLAMTNLTMGLARRFAGEGITVNCIAPGWFDTYRNSSHLNDPEARRRSDAHIPVKRLGRPEDCSGLCLLLCSPAGEYITGQTIYVDGGLSVK